MTALRRVILDGSDLERDEDTSMRFRLTYHGPLKATQDRAQPGKTDRRAEHKHSIRRQFHAQLKQLWATDKFLREARLPYTEMRQHALSGARAVWAHDPSELFPMSEVMASRYNEFGYRFVPLVREDEHLTCALRILFLRRDAPGAIYNLGDIDNRIKTVLDALRRPTHANQIPGPPEAGEDPFFVLLEDDKLVTHLEVETDTLLLPPTSDPDDAALATLVISADVRPHYVTLDNSSFLS